MPDVFGFDLLADRFGLPAVSCQRCGTGGPRYEWPEDRREQHQREVHDAELTPGGAQPRPYRNAQPAVPAAVTNGDGRPDICANCGGLRPPAKRSTLRYCSNACKQAAYRNRRAMS